MYELLITSTSTFLMPVRVCQLVTRLTKPHNTFYPLEHEHIRCALCLSFVQVWVKLWLSTFATHARWPLVYITGMDSNPTIAGYLNI